MIRPFENNQHVYFHSSVHARLSSSITGTVVYINQGAEGVVKGYSHEGTEEKMEDDLLEVEITEGDEKEGQTVWVPYLEFSKLHKKELS